MFAYNSYGNATSLVVVLLRFCILLIWILFFNKSYLYRNPSRLAQYIIARIKSPSDDVGALYDFIQSRFGVEKNIERWGTTDFASG